MSASKFKYQLLVALLLSWFVVHPCLAQEGLKKGKQKGEFLAESGQIDGAIWKFELTPVDRGPKTPLPIKGRYRVADLKVYQAEKESGEMTRQIGQCKPNQERKNTEVVFENLRGVTAPKQPAEPIKGKALLEVKKFGELEGDFVDSKGFKWKMIATRIRE